MKHFAVTADEVFEISGGGVHRAYGVLEVKAVNDEQRVIEGIATSPAPDRLGDIIEPLGVTYKNPLPLLWQHHKDQPIGQVRFDKPTKDGITFRAKMPNVEEPGKLKDRIDEAWQSVKLGLVRGVSIGFRSLDMSFMDDGGIRFLETEVLELSLVTIPANADATIQTIKSFDEKQRAASGQSLPIDQQQSPGVSGKAKPTRAKEAIKMSKHMTIAEQLSAFEAKRAAHAARMAEIMNKCAEDCSTLDSAEFDEYDDLEVQVKQIDTHLKRLRVQEEINKAAAAPITTQASSVVEPRQEPQHRISVKANLPQGTAFIRYICARYQAREEGVPAVEIVKRYPHWHNTPEVETALRAAVAVGTTTGTTWAAPLVEAQNLVGEFAELLRASSIIGRIPGLRRVPFNIKVPRQTTGASVNWVGEGKVKPVSALAFDQITMAYTKVAGIVPITEELLRFSSPSAEDIIRRDLAAAITALIDRDFIDPTKAAASGVSPASVTNGVTPVTATGTTADAFRTDFGTLLAEYTEANEDLGGLVLVMTQTQAMRLSFMVNTLGQDEFPGLTPSGGTLRGIPVITSENIVSTGGSPADGSLIVAINARDILLADDGGVNIDVSREASLQMDDSPDSPATASTVLVSLWQHNMVGIRAERFINWAKRRATAVQFIQNAKYA